MLCSCEKFVFNFMMQALISNRLNGKLIKWLNKPIVKLQIGKVTNGLMEICSSINNYKEKQLEHIEFYKFLWAISPMGKSGFQRA